MGNPKRNRIVDLLLLGVGVLLLLLGVAIHWPKERIEFVGLFFEHLGVGLFAVTVLKVFIEEAAHEQFLSLLRTDVKSQLTTVVISLITRSTWILTNDELKQELEKSVLAPEFIRPFYNLALKLEPLDDRRDFLRVGITINYQVKNISSEERPHVVAMWLDDVIKLGDPATGAGFKKVKIGSIFYDIAALIRQGSNQGGRDGAIYVEDHLIYLKDLATAPIKPNGTLDIIIEGMQIMRTEDHFVWNLAMITEKLDISIDLSGGLTFDQLEVWPREMHHMNHEEFMKPWDKSEPNVRKLKIDQVLLPFQGVELRWAPKPKSSVISGAPPQPSATTS